MNYLNLNYSVIDVFRLVEKLQSKIKVFTLLIQILLLGLLELLGIAIIVPVMKVLLDDEMQMHFQSLINSSLNVDLDLLVVKYMVVLALVSIFSIKIFGIYYINKSQISNLINIQNKMGFLILKNTIGRGYEKMNLGDANGIINLLNHEIDLVTNNYILPSLILITELLTIVLIIIIMIYYVGINIFIASVFAALSFNYINAFINKKLSVLGVDRTKYANTKLMYLRDIYGFDKELFSFKIVNKYLNKYSLTNQKLLEIEKAHILYKSIPRLVIEFLVIFLFSLGLLYIIFTEQDVQKLIPLMAMIAVALFRLIPSLNRIYGCISNIEYSQSVFTNVLQKIEVFEENRLDKNQQLNTDIYIERIEMGSTIYQDISLFNRNLNIIYGRSGIGKTTFADVICGLFEVKNAKIYFNERVMNSFDSLAVSYVTQKNYFISGTIRENLAISNESTSDIRMHDLIEKIGLKNELQDRFGVENILDCQLYSAGTDLSGGQYQRLAIIRGILRDADVYVFDEPTSALDSDSKRRVLFAINELAKEKMVVVVSHDNELIDNTDYHLVDLAKYVTII